MSSSSSTMTIPAALRITSTVLDVPLAVPTRVLPTPSSPQGTCGRPEILSGSWLRPVRPSTLNCFSLWTLGVGEEVGVAECVTAAAAPTTLTSCIRRSVIAACARLEVAVEVAAKTAAVASTVTAAAAVMETARLRPPLPPSETEAGIAGIATTRRLISTRVTTAAEATTPAAEASLVEVQFRISPASRRLSLARSSLLHRQGCCSL